MSISVRCVLPGYPHHVYQRGVRREPVFYEDSDYLAGIVERAEDYLWSSAAAHCNLRDDILIAKDFPPAGVISNWSEWLRIDHADDEKKAIRRHLSTGRPWGTPEFIRQLEALTGRSLRPRLAGRRKKEK